MVIRYIDSVLGIQSFTRIDGGVSYPPIVDKYTEFTPMVFPFLVDEEQPVLVESATIQQRE